LLIALPACWPRPSPKLDAVVEVTVKDFRIDTAGASVRSGLVAFDVHNRGPSTHEFVVMRTELGDGGLPLQADGLTVDEDSTALRLVGEDDDIDLGDTRSLVLRLPPGHYVLFCNLEGHYLGGMHASIEVGNDGRAG
jgi:uncharacterized cupredoxin-like copper-binding protein